MIPRTDQYIFYQGEKYQVEFYFTENCKIPAKELLEKIKHQKELVKLAAFVKLISDEGIIYINRSIEL